jgi:hypothetical protein
MSSMNDTGGGASPASGRTSHLHRLRGLAVTGFVAALAAMVATTLAAALAQAVGVDFEVAGGAETIPLSGFAAVSLTAISLVAPLLAEASTATTTALLGLHLVPAAVMIPTLARSLHTRTV